MWRVGHKYAEQKAKQLPTITKQKNVRATKIISQSSLGQKLPRVDDKMIDPLARRGSIVAVEHLMKKRSSRLLLKQQSRDEIPLDHIKIGQYSRRSSVNLTTKRFREISDKITRVMNNFDSSNEDDDGESDALICDIEEGLEDVDDDMLRINILSLIRRCKKLQHSRDELREQQMLGPEERLDEQNEVLESLRVWLESDREECEEFLPTLPKMIGTEKVKSELKQVMQKVNKLNELERRIRGLRMAGSDAQDLENQMNDLQKEMTVEVKKLQTGKPANLREFNYIRHAATEIYELIQKTKMEGMANTTLFEGQLTKILQEMESTKAELSQFQDIVCDQKDVINRWAKDYEKLKNELAISGEEKKRCRDEIRRVRLELMQHKQKVFSFEKSMSSGDIMKKEEHESIVAEYDKNLKGTKQNLVVMSKTLEEKNNIISGLTKQAARLKNSLRKVSNASTSSEISLQNSVPELASRPSNQRNCMSQDSSKSVASSTESLVHSNSEALVSALREEVENLRERLNVATAKSKLSLTGDLHQSSERLVVAERPIEKEPSRTSIVSRKREPSLVSQETQTVESLAVYLPKHPEVDGDAPVAPPLPEVSSIGCQTQTPAKLPYVSFFEREALSKMCQMLLDKLGPEWLSVARKLSDLEQEDITELNKGLVVESDLLRICSGSPTNDQKVSTKESSSQEGKLEIENFVTKMLEGESPDELEQSEPENVKFRISQVEKVISRVSDFIKGAKNAVNTQAGLMNEVNNHICQTLPKEEEEKIKTEDKSNKNVKAVCSEHLKEWQEMDSLEQANYKMNHIEEKLVDLVKETNDIITVEVSKQKKRYSRLHSIAKNSKQLEFTLSGKPLDNKIQTFKENVNRRISKESSHSFLRRTSNVTRIFTPNIEEKSKETLLVLPSTPSKQYTGRILVTTPPRRLSEDSNEERKPEASKMSQIMRRISITRSNSSNARSGPRNTRGRQGRIRTSGLGHMVKPVLQADGDKFIIQGQKKTGTITEIGTGSVLPPTIPADLPRFNKKSSGGNQIMPLHFGARTATPKLDLLENKRLHRYSDGFRKLAKSSGIQQNNSSGFYPGEGFSVSAQAKKPVQRNNFSFMK